MKREGLWEKLRLLNPKNLQREVHVYGYRFSWRTHLMAVIAALVGIGGIGIFGRGAFDSAFRIPGTGT